MRRAQRLPVVDHDFSFALNLSRHRHMLWANPKVGWLHMGNTVKYCRSQRQKRDGEYTKSLLALQTTTMKTLEYPLPATTLSATECAKILWPALHMALPQSHLQWRFPCTLLHAPLSAMGLGPTFIFYPTPTRTYPCSCKTWPQTLRISMGTALLRLRLDSTT